MGSLFGTIGSRANVAHAVIGVGVGLTAAGLAEQLVQGIIGIGIGVGSAVFRIRRDVPKLVVLIAIGIESIPGTDLILVRTDLAGGLGRADVPVGVVAVQKIGIYLAQPLEGIVGQGEAAKGGIALLEGHIGKAALGLAVGEYLGIGGVAYGPLLPGELVIGIIDLPGMHKGIAAAILYGAGGQPTQGVIAIGVNIAGLAVGDPVKLTVTGIGVGQDAVILWRGVVGSVASCLDPTKNVIGKGDSIIITVGLLREQAVLCSVIVGRQTAGAS